MKTTLISQRPDTYVAVFDKGDEVIEGLKRFAGEHRLSGGHFTGIGAFNDLTLGFFDCSRRGYRKVPVEEFVEVLSLVGDLSLKDDRIEVHAHVVVAKSDCSAHGGHLLRGVVWPTLELIVTESPLHLHRVYDAETGLSLIDPEVRDVH